MFVSGIEYWMPEKMSASNKFNENKKPHLLLSSSSVFSLQSFIIENGIFINFGCRLSFYCHRSPVTNMFFINFSIADGSISTGLITMVGRVASALMRTKKKKKQKNTKKQWILVQESRTKESRNRIADNWVCFSFRCLFVFLFFQFLKL